MLFYKPQDISIALLVSSLHMVLHSKNMLTIPMDTLKREAEKGAGAGSFGQMDSIEFSLRAAFHLEGSVWMFLDAHNTGNLSYNKSFSVFV